MQNVLDPKLRAHFDAHRQGHLDDLIELLRIPSISAQAEHAGDCEACAAWLARRLGGLGLEVSIERGLGRPGVLAESPQRPDRPTLLIYGHYDVQPPDPLELWESPPFEPTVRDGYLYARGASDDKGQLLAWVQALAGYRAVAGDWPVNLKLFFEGEEEVGSPTLGAFVAENARRLACDHIAISDSAMLDARTASVVYSTRGLAYAELTLTGPAQDLHSGHYGGVTVNPLNALARLLAGLHDGNGRVTLEGFYDGVPALSAEERQAWAALHFDEAQLLEETGADALGGEAGFTALERLWARPTLDVNGLWGGYTGEGPKTVIPAWAKAKISCRLVGDQDPQAVLASLRRHLERHAPPGTHVQLRQFAAEEAWRMDPASPTLQVARDAMAEGFERPCVLIGAGGTIPITRMLQRHLGVDPLMVGFGLPDDRIHGPNERFAVDHYHKGILAAASLLARLGRVP